MVIIPCAIQYMFAAYLFYTQQFLSLNLILLPCSFPFLLPTDNLQFGFCICESVSVLLYILICFIFQIPHISDIIQYLSISAGLVSLSIILYRSIHIAAEQNFIHFMAQQYSIVCVCVCVHIISSLSICLLMDIWVASIACLL